jgi:hypothetical protein
MNSIARISQMSGTRFGAAVGAVDEVTATAPAAKPKLPDETMAVLVELQGYTPADRTEWNALVSERHTLNQRTLAFVIRQLAAKHADMERRHEEAKCAVVEQGKVLEGLKKTLVEDTQQWIRVDNACRLAGNSARSAEVDLQNLSRFASKKEIAEAERRVIEANKKFEVSQSKAAEWGQHVNHLKLVTIPNENLKLDALLEKELELSAALEGKDPVLAKFGFLQS